MRAIITLEEKPSIKSICSAIYECLDVINPEYCRKIHDEGIKYVKERPNGTKSVWNFKPFVFSHPYITAEGDIKVKISSPVGEFIYYFLHGKDQKDYGLINKNTPCKVIHDLRFYTVNKIVYSDIFMLSPFTIRTNLGGYIESVDNINAISHLITENLKRKAKAFNISIKDDAYFKIKKIYNVSRKDKCYKNFNIPSFYARMQVSASIDLFTLAYKAGIGSKNALGFGMIEIDQIKGGF